MEDKKRLTINFFAQVFSFVVGFIISFFLTPFIINKLGTDAFGYIGLANNFVSYTTLITIAINSMASRFITISFHKGDIHKADRYFSSVYYSNLFLSGVLFLFSIFIVLLLPYIIKIPAELKLDVRILFGLTLLNSIIALISNVYTVATFVKNRLDLASIRNIVANILRVIVIVIPFLFLSPHLWYYGLSAIVATTFIAITNRMLTKKLLPELSINKKLFERQLVKELISSGSWNLLSSLGNILSTGLDLLLANVLIGAVAMGTLSISNTVPMIILSFTSSIVSVFSPKLTELYARGKDTLLVNELSNNIRITSIFTSIPLIIFLVFGKDFFNLWIPTEDASILYTLSSIIVAGMILALPQESLWSVFTITNKVKVSSINLFIFSILIITTILIGIIYFDNDYYKLLAIVGSRLLWGGIRSLTFLPIFSAKYLGLKWNTFYPIILKTIIINLGLIFFLIFIKKQIIINDWSTFILYTTLASLFVLLIMILFVFKPEERINMINKIKKHLCH